MLRNFTLLLVCIWLSLGMTSMAVESQPELWIESNYPQAPWENITLWCRSPSRVSSKFLLLKDNTQMTWIRPSYKTFQVSFFIGALSESKTGLYRCCYWKEKGWSKPSKILELEAPGQLPKPIFWIQAETPPLRGCNVNILCHGWLQDLVFMLFKEGYTEPVDYQVPTGTMAIFSIDNLAPENEGVYICRTHIQMLPTLWSEPSNPLKLVVAGLYPKPTLTAHPGPILAPGESLSLRCQGPIYGMTFALMRLEDLKKSFNHKKAIKNEAYFYFRSLKIQDTGHYLCFYYDGSYRGSLLSGILKIWVTDTFPKTWLLIRPSPVVQMGQNVSLRCRGLMDGVGLALYKKGEEKPLQLLDATSNTGSKSFLLKNVTYKDAGIYSCHYYLTWKTSIKMATYNTVELMVIDKPPKPSLSAWPSSVFKAGKTITLQCRVSHPVLEFSLEWKERETFQKFSVDGNFIITNTEGQGTGTYSCSYRIKAYPNIWSHRSEPLKLVGPAGTLTWNSILNEALRMSLIVQLVSLLWLVLWIHWKCRTLRLREPWLLGTAQGVAMFFILMALLCCGLCNGALAEEIDILPKPVISASLPIRGQKLQIRCKGWLEGLGFALYKKGEQEPVQQLGAVGREAVFTIQRMEDKEEGNYSCRTHTEMQPFKWSASSEPLELVIKEMYPKPFFKTWASPVVTPGSRVTFNCSTSHEHMSFFLYKDDNEIASSDPASGNPGASEAHFLIISVGTGDGGNYSCRYYDFSIWSEPSDPVELIVTEFYPKPTLLAQPGPVVLPGKNVTLHCQGIFRDMRFALLQEGTHAPLQFQSASGTSVDFLLQTVGAEDSGNYSCIYYETTMSNRGSYLSSPLMIWVTDIFPRPWLSAEPSSVVTMGQNVTLWCQGPVHGVGYILHKEGEATPMQLWGSTSNEGTFSITNISGASIGRYSCCYHPDWMSTIKIQPSNTLELIVTGLLPKPSLLVQPGPMVAPGENMTLQCQGELPDSTFVLLKEGTQHPLEQQKPSGYRADFWMPVVRDQDSGIYSCVYYLDSAPLAASNHSNSLEIWVTDKPPKPSLSAWPSTVFKLGKDITLQCRGPLPGVEFVLEHDGEEAPQQFSEDGDFVINNVEGKGIGNYSCSYRLQAYPDIWSEPSDALELVGAAGPAAQECTVGNIVRSTLIIVVLVALGIVLAIEWKKWPQFQTRDSETDGRDQAIVLEECNQEGEAGTTTNSPSSASQGLSVELTVPI
ncbi:immunoglobulin superfamily member 1 isoform X3 [Meriones unguiculatus]|uniref:immunoglobulin superfamily member 1 isoform X3 n=1 Tax=Meriones unguiculatus TaxID=10047 RepID=UPI00293F34B1|nr:immunoglobulin superfamily member 1 isoform X3 [Meriones unguiculatus]